jgi:hypothetical protein
LDHFAFVVSWENQRRSASDRLIDGGAPHTRHPDHAIIAYSDVQTIGKTAFGGVKIGLSSSSYHTSEFFPGL